MENLIPMVAFCYNDLLALKFYNFDKERILAVDQLSLHTKQNKTDIPIG